MTDSSFTSADGFPGGFPEEEEPDHETLVGYILDVMAMMEPDDDLAEYCADLNRALIMNVGEARAAAVWRDVNRVYMQARIEIMGEKPLGPLDPEFLSPEQEKTVEEIVESGGWAIARGEYGVEEYMNKLPQEDEPVICGAVAKRLRERFPER